MEEVSSKYVTRKHVITSLNSIKADLAAILERLDKLDFLVNAVYENELKTKCESKCVSLPVLPVNELSVTPFRGKYEVKRIR